MGQSSNGADDVGDDLQLRADANRYISSIAICLVLRSYSEAELVGTGSCRLSASLLPKHAGTTSAKIR